MKLNPISFVLATCLGLTSLSALAVTPFTIKDIRVEGAQRTDPGTVFKYLPIKVGGQFNDQQATSSIKSLFATGFFSDVRIETEGNIVIVSVIERPTVADIDIVGAHAFNTKQITEMLKSQNFAIAQIYDQAGLESAIQILKNQYYAQGRYAVNINTSTTKLERNRIGVKITISEGDVASVKELNIVGAKAFKESTLTDEMSTSKPDWLSWYTKTGQFSQEKLDLDLDALRTFYHDRGYLEFDIISTQVNFAMNKESVFITINVHEGEKYTIKDIRFAGELLVPEVTLRKLLEIKSGQLFSRHNLNESTLKIKERLGADGYAFGNVNVVPDIDKKAHTVSLTIYIEPGRKTSVRRVNITGNKRTRDEVIRREIRQMESAPYALDKIKRSRERVDQLGYFSAVNIDTSPVTGAQDMIDLNMNVVENNTGSFQFGVGYGRTEGAALVASLAQNNFLGTGNQFSVAMNTSKSNRVYSVQLLNPYATASGLSLGWNISHRDYKPEDIDLGRYRTSSWLGGVTIGVPISEYNRLNFGLSAENLKIRTNNTTPTYIQNFVKEHGERNWTYITSLGWGHNTLDSGFYPTSGVISGVGAEVSVPPSDIKYYKLTASNKIFLPLTKLTSLMWNIDVGYGKSYGHHVNSGLPFYRNFHAGGVNSVRGYQSGSLSIFDNNGDSVGGNRRIINNVELLFPVPGLKENRATRLSLFWDAGYAFSPNEKVALSTLRHSAGVAFTWISPIGPIKLSYAVPLKKHKHDKVERFQFLLGTAF